MNYLPVSQNETAACLPSRSCMLCEQLSNTVGTYSAGKALVVAVIRKHDFPTAPSPITTHLTDDMFERKLYFSGASCMRER